VSWLGVSSLEHNLKVTCTLPHAKNTPPDSQDGEGKKERKNERDTIILTRVAGLFRGQKNEGNIKTKKNSFVRYLMLE